MEITSQQVVVTNGCFDVLHAGHAKFLEACAAHGSVLMVGLNSDDSVRALKGAGRPVNSQADRLEVLTSLECVDYACIFSGTRATEFLKHTRPHVWCKGADYTLETLDQDEVRAVREAGGRIALVPMLVGYSTTNTLKKITNELFDPSSP